jgi:hypothetical protein
MPILLNNPAHWHLRAQEARLLAAQLEDPVAKEATLRIAEEYDRLAVRATKRMADAAEKENEVPGDPEGDLPT